MQRKRIHGQWPKTIFVANKWYKIKDAVKPKWIHAEQQDWIPGACGDPHNCVMANGGTREHGGRWVVYKTISYWIPDVDGDVAIRFRNYAPVGNLSAMQVVIMHDDKSPARNPVPKSGITVRLSPPKGSASINYSSTPEGREKVKRWREQRKAKLAKGTTKPRRYVRSLSSMRRFTVDKRVAAVSKRLARRA